MKRHIIPFTFILLLIFLCENCADKGVIEKIQTVNIIGNQITGFIGESSTRNTDSGTLPVSSQISFYSQGAINVSGIRLTWTGEYWETSQFPTWDSNQSTADIRAYFPAETIKSQQFYNEDGELTDLLCAVHSCQQSPITLSFQHLFSKVTFRISPSFNRKIQQIIITPSHLISSLTPMAASANFEKNSQMLSVKRGVNQEGEYSIIVPSNQKIILSVKIITSNEEYIVELPEQAYKSGVEYIQTINNQQQGVGIASVEDYIAFSHLINGYEYSGRSLDEFGETVNGETIYYLLKDLTFTEETSEDVMEIGWKEFYKNTPFNATFEGNYHTIKGLSLTGKSDRLYFAIFGYIGETGKVRNLIINDLSINITDSKSTRIGGLAGYNSGIIDNCLLQNFTTNSQSTDDDMNVGGICFVNLGTIMNCTVKSFTISGNYKGAGGISYKDQSKITNCHICSFKNTNRKAYSAISHVVNDSRLTNILCSQIAGNILIQSHGNRYVVQHCYYPSTIDLPFDNDYTKEFIPYDEKTYQCTNGTSVETALNQWVQSDELVLQPWIKDAEQIITLNTYGY